MQFNLHFLTGPDASLSLNHSWVVIRVRVSTQNSLAVPLLFVVSLFRLVKWILRVIFLVALLVELRIQLQHFVLDFIFDLLTVLAVVNLDLAELVGV